MTRRALSALVGLLLLLASVAVGATAAPAAAAPAPSYQVTFVSRVCPTYGDIMANRARNNIQESLRDLGKDTVYTSGQPISPAIEAPNQPNCDPLFDWQFALGTGYTAKTPATDYLSTITGDYGADHPRPAHHARARPQRQRHRAHAAGRRHRDADRRPGAARAAGQRPVDPGRHQGRPAAQRRVRRPTTASARCAARSTTSTATTSSGSASRPGARTCSATTTPSRRRRRAGTIVVRKQLETGTNGPGAVPLRRQHLVHDRPTTSP